MLVTIFKSASVGKSEDVLRAVNTALAAGETGNRTLYADDVDAFPASAGGDPAHLATNTLLDPLTGELVTITVGR